MLRTEVLAGTVTFTDSPRSWGDSEVRSSAWAFVSTTEERTSCASVSRLTDPLVRPLATSVSVPTGWTRTLAVDVYCCPRVAVNA